MDDMSEIAPWSIMLPGPVGLAMAHNALMVGEAAIVRDAFAFIGVLASPNASFIGAPSLAALSGRVRKRIELARTCIEQA